MLVKKLLLPSVIAAAVLAGGISLNDFPVEKSTSGERLVSRTMPPSDPKPSGPKKPRRVVEFNLA